MDFGNTETQELIRASAQEWLAERSPPEFVRAMAEDDQGYTDEYWDELAALGWLGLLIPEEYGGSGMDFADMAVLLHEWGAALSPGPLVESSIVAAAVIEGGDSDNARSTLLPKIAAGEAKVIPAFTVMEDGVPKTRATETSDGWTFHGTLDFVPYANSADVLLVPAETDDGIAIFALDSAAISDSMATPPVRMASGTPTYKLEFNEVVCSSDSMIVGPANGKQAMDRAWNLGATARSIQMVGAGRSVADRTLAYVKERNQFGRAIGSFQAIQHYMADMATKVKSAQLVANRAAWLLDNPDDDNATTARAVSQAKWAANKLMPEVCWTAHQSHGAIGFTWEHDLHLYTRRVLAWRAEYGDRAQTLGELARLVAGEPR